MPDRRGGRRLDRRMAASARHLPVRTRLTAVFAVTMTLVLCALGTVVYVRTAEELLTAVDQSLGVRADALTAALTDGPAPPLGGSYRFADPDEAYAQVLSPVGQVLESSPAVADAPLLTSAQAEAVARPTSFTVRVRAFDDPARLLVVPATSGGQRVLVVVGETLGDRGDTLHRLAVTFAIVGPFGVALTCLVGWLVAGAALRPVEAMRRRAAEISESGGRGRLPVPPAGDDLTRLATTLNSLLDGLSDALDRERRFVSDASHELRTPLAVLKAELELALSRPRDPAELVAALEAASAETERLVHLASDLLALARLREGGAPLATEAVALRPLLEDTVAAVAPDALVDVPDVVVRLDPERVRRAVANLAANAVRHGRPPVTVTATVTDGVVRIVVADAGDGVPAALGEDVWRPFVRGRGGDDDAGTGLGLAIVSAVATAHHGSVELRTAPGGGTQAELEFVSSS